MPTPNPGPYLSTLGLTFDAQLLSVSCPGRRACHAVGWGLDSTADFVMIDERFDGASWQLETIPFGSGIPEVGGVSCPTGSSAWPSATISSTGIQGTTLAAKWTP